MDHRAGPCRGARGAPPERGGQAGPPAVEPGSAEMQAARWLTVAAALAAAALAEDQRQDLTLLLTPEKTLQWAEIEQWMAQVRGSRSLTERAADRAGLDRLTRQSTGLPRRLSAEEFQTGQVK